MPARRMRHTRKDVLARAQREFEELDALIRRLRPVDWDRRVPRPETRAAWTVKDALAHVIFWKEHSARVFRGEKRPPDMRGLDVEALNALVYDRWRDRTPEEIVTWHRAVHGDVMRTLSEVPDERITGREHSPDWPADFDGHSAGHRLKDVEAALGD